MTVIVAVIVGFLTGRMLWLAMRKSWSRPPLMRNNFQGVTLPTAAGVVLSLSLLLIEAGRQVIGALGAGQQPGLTGVRAGALVAVLAFTVLGLLDDLVGASGSRGFAGHTRALMQGELTSGMVKAIGGATASLIAAGLIVSGSSNHGVVALVLDAAIIALSANFFNLLDLRPGRSAKVAIFIFAATALLAKFDTALVPAAIVVGATAAIILDDLHERLMLGDTGANAMGAAVGFGIATQITGTGRIIVVVALLALNLLSEVVSYSKFIEGFASLKALDNMGRKRSGPLVDVRDQGESRHEPPFPTGAANRAPIPGTGNRGSFGEDPFGEPPFTDRSDPPFASSRERDQGNVGGAPETDDHEMDLRDPLFDDEEDGRNGYPHGTGHRSDRI